MPDIDWGDDATLDSEIDWLAQAQHDAAQAEHEAKLDADWRRHDEEMAAAEASPDDEALRPEPVNPFGDDEHEVIEGEVVKELDPEEVTAGLRLFLLQAVVNDAVADYTRERRVSVDELVHKAAKKFSTGQFAVNVETIDGAEELLAKITPKYTKESTKVRDERAFLAWLKANAQQEVEVEHVEEQVIPAHDVERIKKGALDRIMATAKVTDDGTLITEDGVPIDGLTHTPQGKPNGTLITWGGTGSPSKKRALKRLLNGELKGTTTNDIVAQTQAQIEEKK